MEQSIHELRNDYFGSKKYPAGARVTRRSDAIPAWFRALRCDGRVGAHKAFK